MTAQRRKLIMCSENDGKSQRELQRAHDEVERHIKHGHERIVGWYIDNHEVGQGTEQNEICRDEVERLIDDYEQPPHQSIINKSILFLEKALDRYEDDNTVKLGYEETLTPDLYYLYLSIGTEILMNGIILKTRPEFFRETYLKHNRSLGLGAILCDTHQGKQVKNELRDHLFAELSEEQQNLIDDTLALIHLQRNNLVHLGYHTFSQPKNWEAFHHVLAYLVSEFTDQNSVAQRLIEHGDLELIDTEGYSLLPVDH
ncbi:hypothetical protein [Haloarcula argentinensis]|uniref:DUF4145 domain-containing protein n=1 Tax=Haloarcula argentinensis TaxID=43776 RepID=A0ABU2F2B8_HALAR|nr:hypothetical protein [Haloarcula argentinensis]MDS0254702.1 hypothetical protein [Haloarcula argentinensis]